MKSPAHRARRRSLAAAIYSRVLTGTLTLIACTTDLEAQRPEAELAPGLRLEVAAAPPLVKYPTLATFDDRGRLFVCDGEGKNLNRPGLERLRPHLIRVLEDHNNDGRFDRSTVFVDGLTFPQGALWLHDSLYVMSPPSLWRFEDTDGDRVADVREEVVTGFDFTGNAADVHGPFLHPNGRIYWCHGRKGHEVHDPHTGELVSKAKGARIWSCWPDGSDLEVHAGGGMDNPVELVFHENGDILGDVNLFHGRPRGDVLVHWLRGGVYPRRDQGAVIAEFKRTGPLLGEVHNFGHVAVSGMARYLSGRLNPEWTGDLLVAHFNTQQITRTQIAPEGSTWSARETGTLLRFKDSDVHLTDVLEAPNGDVLVVDTGGWFRNGCPTSQVAKPQVLGRIYRLVPDEEGATQAEPRRPRLTPRDIDWPAESFASLAYRLDATEAPIRERASEEIAVRGEAAIPLLEAFVLDPTSSQRARLTAVWTLSRMRFSDASDLLLAALSDLDPTIRQAACVALDATRRRPPAVGDPLFSPDQNTRSERNRRISTRLIEIARSDEPAVARAAATALGRIGDSRAVGALLGVLGREEIDRAREHACLFALVELDDPEFTRFGLSSDNPKRRAAALLALDQMPSGDLEPLEVLDLLEADDESLRLTALEVLLNRPTWDAALANRFHEWLDEGPLPEPRVRIMAETVPAFLDTPPMQTLMSHWLQTAPTSNAPLAPFEAIATSQGTRFLDDWEEAFRASLGEGGKPVTRAAVQALARAPDGRFAPELEALAADETQPPSLRILCLDLLNHSRESLSPAHFSALLTYLEPPHTPADRAAACQLLSSSPLSETQRLALAPQLSALGPIDLPHLLSAFRGSRSPGVAKALGAALRRSPARASLSPADLRELIERFPPESTADLEALAGELETSRKKRSQRLNQLVPKLPLGDPDRGQKVFASGKGACLVCHKVGAIGRDLGPELSHIGRIRTRRDLLESILYPSETFARDFEPFLVTLADGRELLGMVQQETPEALHLVDAAGMNHRFPRADIKKLEPASTSLMPPGLEQGLSEQALLDLVAYLRSLQ